MDSLYKYRGLTAAVVGGGALAYLTVLQISPSVQEAMPLGAPMAVALSTNTASVSTIVAGAGYHYAPLAFLPNPMADEPIKAAPVTPVTVAMGSDNPAAMTVYRVKV